MQLNRENWGDYLWPNYTKIIGEGYDKKPEQWKQIFREYESERAFEKFSHIGTLPPWRLNNEGNVFNESEKVLGPEGTIYMHRYDNSFKITYEYMEDNMKAVMGGRTEGGNGPLELGEGCRKRIEIDCADVINKGFTEVGYDGVPLFSTSHPLAGVDEVVSNIAPNGKEAITNDNMEDAIIAMKTSQKDEAGYDLKVNPDKIAISSDLEFKVARIFHSAQVAGTDLNDKNVLPGIQVVVMDYFDLGTWVLIDSTIENLVFYWRDKPFFDYFRIPNTLDYKFWGACRYGVGYTDWRGLYGAKIPRN